MQRNGSGSAKLVAPFAKASREHHQLAFESVGAGFHDVTEDVAARDADYVALLQAAVRVAVLPYATPGPEAQWVRDQLRPVTAKRGGPRCRDTKRLAEIAARGDKPNAIGDALNDYARRRVVRVEVAPHEALIAETKEQAEADIAVAQMHRDQTPQARQRAVEELRDHARAATVAADTLAVTR